MKEILITSSVLIVALILLRLLFSKKVSRTLIYGAWILVALRLLIPVQIGQLSFSVLTATQDMQQTLEQVETRPVSGPSKQEVYQDIVVDYVQKDPSVFIPQVQEQIREEVSHGATSPAEIVDKIQQKYPQQELFTPEVEQQVQQQVAQTQTAPTLGQIAKAVWLVGVAGMALWFAIVNLRHGWLLRGHARKLACESTIPVYVSEKVGSPCLVGLLRPVIYVTPRCAENEELLRHVLKHELTHYRHGDHIWSLVRCICLCVYWFDPLVWAAAYLSRRDCELACDEGAMKGLDEADRLAYGKTLLEVVSHAASPGKLLHTATSMNETMKQLKERVNFIVRKPKFSITAAICMVLICAIVAGCAVAGPTSGHSDPPATTPTTTNPPVTTVPPTTEPQPDVRDVKTLASDMHYSMILTKDLSLAGQYVGEADLTVTEFDDNSVSLEGTLSLSDDFWYDFTHPGNIFDVQHEELGLPYYCAKALIYQPGLDGYLYYDFAVDIEKGYLIYKESANITQYYVVASCDPNVDPLQIVEHFSMFLHIYDHTSADTGIVTDFYYDNSGVWISENDEILGEMPLYITGTLPAEYEDGDNVEMELNFIWPESTGYRNEGLMTYTGGVDIFEKVHEYINFHGTGTLYDTKTNEQIPFSYNIFPLYETVIIHVNGNYLFCVPWDTSNAVSKLNYYKEFIFTAQKPADPNRKELKKFNDLFRDWNGWYNRALTFEYTDPTQIKLEQLFYLGFVGESRDPTDEEWVQLKKQPGFNFNFDLIRLPVDKMNQVLTDLFGITLEDVDEAGFEDLVYLESTNCYYHMVTDALWTEDFEALSVENMEDGSIRVYYTADGESTVRCVTVMPHGDGYRILSNVLLSDPAQDLYTLEAELAQRIEDAWHQENRFGYWDTQTFCAPTGTEDGIRYYGSYMLGDMRCDIVYIPCADLAIPSEITLGGYTFRSRTGFALYAFCSKELPSLGMTMSTFTPLKGVVDTVSASSFDVVLATAAKLHGEYERRIYGSELTEIPQAGPDQNMLRLKALWLMHRGVVPEFQDGGWLCYYGSYNGYDIVFEQTMLTAQLTITIGGEKFVYSSHFILHAIKDGEFYKLQDVYAAGSISREDIAQIAAEHKSQHGHLTEEHPE